ncbi:MAG: suppressor of fused domain protein, partial [Planctomycetes bacterium]|nr:suppressor of fused domain protein [Planctomycetota bacterium]
LGKRGRLSVDDSFALARFVANLTEYPFMYSLKLDWWERVANPGSIPGFPDCTQLLLAPDLGTAEMDRFDRFQSPDDDVRILRVIPITPRENYILKERGRVAFLDYWTESGIDIWSPRSDDDDD